MKLFLRRPKLDPRTREDIDLYSTDELRVLLRTPPTPELIRLRGSIPTGAEVIAEIHYRLAREDRRFWITLVVAIAGAVAAGVAALPVIFARVCGG
jgi:hypothetical protein